jgi:hypothetical protein
MANKAEMFNAQYLAVYLDFVDQALMVADKFEVSAIALLTQMYGPAARCKKISSNWRRRSCINVSGL